jgi:transposase
LCTSESNLGLPEVESCLCGSLKEKTQELYRSVQGFFEKHHREQLTMLLATIEGLERQIAQLDQKIRVALKDHHELLERMKEVPGISDIAAHSIISETGETLVDFPTAAAFASWCGLCPGNNQSAGKRRSGRIRVTRNHLKTLMVEVAWAAVKKRGSYYKDKYYRLRGRLGPKKAIVAIAHRILKAIYHIIKDRVPFKDLGENFILEQNRDAKLKYLKKQAKLLGHELIPIPKRLS